MGTGLMLSAAGEEAWQSLRYHVEWAQGFALIVLFSSTPALYNILRQRLANIYQTRVSHLQHLTPACATTLVEDIMGLIRAPDTLHAQAMAPLWLDLARGQEPAWQRARDNLMARLNEHRELLRQRFRRPFIMVLPAGYRQRLRELAPDLWSIRTWSVDVDEQERTSLQFASTTPGVQDASAFTPETITLKALTCAAPNAPASAIPPKPSAISASPSITSALSPTPSAAGTRHTDTMPRHYSYGVGCILLFQIVQNIKRLSRR